MFNHVVIFSWYVLRFEIMQYIANNLLKCYRYHMCHFVPTYIYISLFYVMYLHRYYNEHFNIKLFFVVLTEFRIKLIIFLFHSHLFINLIRSNISIYISTPCSQRSVGYHFVWLYFTPLLIMIGIEALREILLVELSVNFIATAVACDSDIIYWKE